MIVKSTRPTYAQHRAALKTRARPAKQLHRDGRWMIVMGLLILFIPGILGPDFISPAGAVIWMIIGIYWLSAGLKAVGL